MADTKISQDYATNPFTWDGTEILPGVKSSANGAGLVSALRTFFATLNQAQNEAPPVTIASSGSVAIGAAASNTITVTGTNTITSFDTIAAGAWRRVVFSGVLTLTHNATSLILPSGANITTGAGDTGEFLSLGSGNWKCVSYTRANGSALTGSAFTGGTLSAALNEAPQVTIASAATTDIGAATANSISVTGTTTITGLGTIPSGALRRVVFAGALTLTHSGTALILPGGANITTAAGDVAWFESMGSGNWRCVGYHKASGAAVAGGGGLTGFTSSLLTASPNNTTNVSQILASGGTANQQAAFTPKGTGGVSAHAPDSTSAGGNVRGTNSVDWQTQRSAATQVASGGSSTVGGGLNNTASGTGDTVAGGNGNVASGGYSSVAGGGSNTTSSNYASCGGGFGNNVSGNYAYAVGNTNTATGNVSRAEGEQCTADAAYSSAYGFYATVRTGYGFSAYSSRLRAALGDSQRRFATFGTETTNATPKLFLSDNSGTAGTGNQLRLPSGAAYTFNGKVVAYRPSNGDFKSWTVQGGVSNFGGTMSNGTTAPTATVVTATAGASTWDVTFSLDSTNKAQQILATGQTSATIEWTLYLESVETTG